MPDHTAYEDLMGNKSLGFFLYHPKRASDIKPGACGYFDNDGHFHLIDSPGKDQKIENEPIANWEPVAEHCAFNASGKADIKAEFPGLPAGAGTKFEFTSNEATAAALLTASVRQRYIGDRASLTEWAKDKCNDLITGKYGTELKEHGFWVIDRTYMTPKCSIAFWRGKGRTMSIGLSGAAYSNAKLTASGRWEAVSGGGSWRTIPDTSQKDYSAVLDDECMVISIMGIHYEYSLFRGATFHPRAPTTFMCEAEGKTYLMEGHVWGLST